jgi:uncharacterized protein
MSPDPLDRLKQFLKGQQDLEFAVLVGSRTNGRATATSDWDIAIQWQRDDRSYLEYLARTEKMRQAIAKVLQVSPDQVDLIDVPATKLAMRELIANHGMVLAGEESLPWFHFLQRTWRDLEDYYWDEIYAA